MSTVAIRTHHFLERDIDSMSINNNDVMQQRALRRLHEARAEKDAEMATLKENVRLLHEDMTEIKTALHTLISKGIK